MDEWRQKLQHMQHYDKIASLYNSLYAEEQNLKIDAIFKSFKPQVGSSILDLGCGTGLLLRRIQKIGKEIVELDISKGMLMRLLKLARNRENVHLVLADADYIPIRHRCFDMIFAFTLLQNMPRPDQTLKEMKRVMKSNAFAFLTGLRKHFKKRFFLELIKNSKLSLEGTIMDRNLKCYLAICRMEKS